MARWRAAFLPTTGGLRTVFFLTASVLLICFILTLFFIREQFVPVAKKEMLNARDVFSSLKSPKLVLSLFVTTMIIQVATGSIAPILTPTYETWPETSGISPLSAE